VEVVVAVDGWVLVVGVSPRVLQRGSIRAPRSSSTAYVTLGAAGSVGSAVSWVGQCMRGVGLVGGGGCRRVGVGHLVGEWGGRACVASGCGLVAVGQCGGLRVVAERLRLCWGWVVHRVGV